MAVVYLRHLNRAPGRDPLPRFLRLTFVMKSVVQNRPLPFQKLNRTGFA